MTVNMYYYGSFVLCIREPETKKEYTKKWILDLGDILLCSNVQTNYLLASKWKLNFKVIFHITPSSCQLHVLLDIDISTRFKVSLFTVYDKYTQMTLLLGKAGKIIFNNFIHFPNQQFLLGYLIGMLQDEAKGSSSIIYIVTYEITSHNCLTPPFL